MPNVTCYVLNFSNDWLTWYKGLQPTQQSASQENKKLIPESNPWGKLRKGSQNRFFLLLLTIGWWGVGTLDQGTAEIERWGKAFDNLHNVLYFWVTDEDKEEGEEEEEEEDNKEQELEESGMVEVKEGEAKSIPAKCTTTSKSEPVAKRYLSVFTIRVKHGDFRHGNLP